MVLRDFYRCYFPFAILICLNLSCNQVDNSDYIIPCIECSKIETVLDEFKLNHLTKSQKLDLLNEAYELSTQLKVDSLKSLYIFKISNKMLKLKEYSSFRDLSEEYLLLAEELNDTMRIADYYWNMGLYYSKIEVSDSAFYSFKKASQNFSNVGHKYYEAKMDYNMAFILRRSKNYIESEAYAFNSISKLNSQENKVLLYRDYNHLGLLYYDMKQYDYSINYHQKALNIVSVLPKGNIYLERSLNNLSLIYQKQEKYDLAIETLNEALENSSLREKHSNLYAKLIDNKAFCMFLNEEDDNLLQRFNEALAIRQNLENEAGIVISHSHLAQYFLKKKDSMKALAYAKSAYEISSRLGMNRDILESLELLSKTDPSHATGYMNQYTVLNDSLIQQERKIREKFTRIQFETENYMAANENLKKKNIWISLTSGLALFSLSLFFFLYRQRSKNKTLLLEQQQHGFNEEIYDLMLKKQNRTEEGRIQERVRISHELHDGILARLFSVRIGLGFLNVLDSNKEKEQYDSFMKELQLVEKEIRTLSHDLKNDDLSSKKDFTILLSELLEEQSRLGGFRFQLKQDQSIAWNRVDEMIKINLYRMVQEAICNIIKYAKADEVKVSLTRENDFFELRIVDDGVGFDTNKKNNGIGLKNMASRANSIAAKIQIKSQVNNGTIITVSIPTKTLYHEGKK